VKRLKEFAALYRIYRQCNPRLAAIKLAWLLSGE